MFVLNTLAGLRNLLIPVKADKLMLSGEDKR